MLPSTVTRVYRDFFDTVYVRAIRTNLISQRAKELNQIRDPVSPWRTLWPEIIGVRVPIAIGVTGCPADTIVGLGRAARRCEIVQEGKLPTQK